MQDIIPLHYKIRLEPDLTDFKFEGCVELDMETSSPVEEVVLNILDIVVWSCSVENSEKFWSCSFTTDPKKEELLIHLPKRISGKMTIKIDFQGEINDRMAGFYRSKYTSKGKAKYVAVTQFEESDARRAFPCMDHPSKKATFDVEMVVDKNLAAISNGAVKEEIALKNGKKCVMFEQTPKMSTYLVFFGVGEFEILQDEEDSRVRVVTLPGMQKYAQFGLDFGRKALHYSESYYKIPYPLTKMDLIAIPDFAFGAMENWGAITFRENLLLYYPDITSRSGEQRICEVIAHEIAHQWFGNLVTPSDWKFLWLNESFATYFGYGIVAHYHPEWDAWEQFLQDMTASAMQRDSLKETFAMEIPGGEHVVINTSTAPIIYNKGGSILRHIQGYIGDKNFRNGLQRYLKNHEYGCAASHHLWEALEEVSEQPVKQMMISWIEQPGFPIIEAKREGPSLRLKQRRFTYLPDDSDQTWLVPVTIIFVCHSGEMKRLTTLLDEPEKIIEIEKDVAAYKINDRQTGFYRVKYNDSQNLEQLKKLIEKKSLPAEDRWGLQNDLYSLVRCGENSVDDYLDFLSHYQQEDDFLPLLSIAGNLFHAYMTLDDSQKARISSLAVPWFESILKKIGYQPHPEEKSTISMLRDHLIWEAVQYGSKQTAEFSFEKFTALRQGASIHPDIMKSVMKMGAWSGDSETFDWFDQRFKDSEVEHERMNILIACGCFRDKEAVRRVLHYVLETVPLHNKFVPVMSMALNRDAKPYLWEWYIENLEQIERFHPVHYERVIASLIPSVGIEKPEEVKAFFSEYRKKKDKFEDVIKMSTEKLEINLLMRERNC